jgi:hypothetical protein
MFAQQIISHDYPNYKFYGNNPMPPKLSIHHIAADSLGIPNI